MNLFTAAETTANYSLAGANKTKLAPWKMFLLGILAGMLIAFGAAVTNTGAHTIANVGLARIVSGLLFPFGLAMVVIMGAELFTGNCLIVISVLDGKAALAGMLKNWFFVYCGNFAGAALVAAGCAFFGQLNYSGGGLAVFTIQLAAGKCGLPFGNALVMGVFCNILVTLGVLLSLAAKCIPGRLVGAYLPVAFFVICGFEHSVANMFYVPAGLFALQNPVYAAKAAEAGLNLSNLTWGSFLLKNLLPVTLGNIIGGVAVGALMWACHLYKARTVSEAK